MKKNFFMMLVILTTTYANAQTNDFICATPDDNTPDPIGAFSYSTELSDLQNYEPVVFNVFLWGINQDDGTSTKKLTETMALKVIADLNIKFNDANIFFKYYGYDYINSSRFYNIYRSCNDPNDEGSDSCLNDFSTFLSQNPQYVNQDAINYHIPRNTVGFAGAGYHTQLRTVINAWAIENNPRVINHEMGHAIGLLHTQNGWTSASNCEHVTRDPFDLDDPTDPYDTFFNADDAGDRVTDTAAVPDFRNEKCKEDGYSYPYFDCPSNLKYYYLDEETCTYENSFGADCQGTSYEIEEEDVRNLMAYTLGTCGLDLTIGQNIRMREKIEDNPNIFDRVTTTIESLYEPYKGVYTNGPVVSYGPAKFQPGFDYKFLNCGPDGEYPQPSDYSNTSFNYIEGGFWWYGFNKNIEPPYFNTISHKNGFAVRIEQLQFQPRKCWNNGIATGGTIITFNDGVLNTNVTITAQDSAAINSQQMVNDLEPGLYNVIKEYEDGRTEETIILKENN